MSKSTQNFDDEMTTDEFDELLDHAEENLTGFILATAAYGREHDFSFADWAQFVGSKVAPTWSAMRGTTPISVARLSALNLLAGGAEIHSVDGDDARAEIVCTWPHDEDLEYFGLTRDDLDPFFDAYEPIAAELDLQYLCQRDDDRVTMVYER